MIAGPTRFGAAPTRALSVVLLGVLLGMLASYAQAQPGERILDYDIEVDIRADGSLIVAEHITVRAEQNRIRRGIYRDFPTRYRDRYGNRVVVDLDVLGVERDGVPEPWFTERVSNGVRINTGNDDFLPRFPAEYRYTLRYRTTRQLGFFEDHDELYWNAIGTGWDFAIESGSVEVRLPEPVPTSEMQAEGYTGPQGARGQAYRAELAAPGVARFELTEPLAPREGLTIVLSFPKGVVAAPTTAERAGSLLADNGGLLVALVGFALLIAYCMARWRSVGRDPRRGVIIPRYEPPEGRSPAELRYLRRRRYDPRCFTADLLVAAVDGHLEIEREPRMLLGDRWYLRRAHHNGVSDAAPTDDPIGAAPTDGPIGAASTEGASAAALMDGTNAAASMDGASAAAAMDGASAAAPTGGGKASTSLPTVSTLARQLLGKRDRIELAKKNASELQRARTLHAKALNARLHGSHFRRHVGSVVAAGAIVLLTGLLAFAVASGTGGGGEPAISAVLVAMGVVVFAFGWLVQAPTQEGRRLMDEAEGLKLYLSVAERDELRSMDGPEGVGAPTLDEERYERLLPYAVALDVEEAWTEKFTAAVGAAAAAAATARIGWYHGGRGDDLGGLAKAVGAGLSASIASASTPPGSSSGAGGGGFSGGGGGGGGGGGR